jgi:hypothetical protein
LDIHRLSKAYCGGALKRSSMKKTAYSITEKIA